MLPEQERDLDGDGYVSCTIVSTGWLGVSDVVGGDDCDDTEQFRFPNAQEVCDGIINTCGGTLPLDEADSDGDSYVECVVADHGWQGNESIIAGIDCDDADAFIFPDAPELCDGIDNNCDSIVPSNEIDDDNDNFVECDISFGAWKGESDIIGGGDCDDTKITMYPEAPELCDGIVNSCGIALPSNELDLDGDGYVVCEITGDWLGDSSILDGEDCDDDNDTIYPNAPELCDGIVNTCDGVLPDVEKDIDSDGYVECEVDVNGWKGDNILGGGDCDIESPFVYPQALELCDGIINTCGGIYPMMKWIMMGMGLLSVPFNSLIGVEMKMLLEGIVMTI